VADTYFDGELSCGMNASCHCGRPIGYTLTHQAVNQKKNNHWEKWPVV